jgi:predicted dehydrogenase
MSEKMTLLQARQKLGRRLRLGMGGGGPGSFIGDVHLKAAGFDDMFELTAGAFDINPKKSKERGRELLLPDDRVYENTAKMVTGEMNRQDKIDLLAITTPNNWHFPIAKQFLDTGLFHIMCEKPMTFNVEEAKQMVELVNKSGRVFGLMHNYTGYPMVKVAREMVRRGKLGKIRKIVVQYPQGWLATFLEKTGQMQAAWRTDPKQSGGAGCMGDIGTHAENLAEYISGLKITQLCADLKIFVKGRKLDDDGNVILHFNNGACGVLHASQVSVGEENNLAIWIYGTKAGLHWDQEHPNYLYFTPKDRPTQIWKRGNDYVADFCPLAGNATRLPSGHPEAFFEAFANNYKAVAAMILESMLDVEITDKLDCPTVGDGLRGMQFIQTVLDSDKSNLKWTKFVK